MASHPQPNAESPRRWAPTACLVGACFGLVTIAVGALWKSTTTPATFWSQEQAAEYAAAHDAYHAALHGHVGAGHDQASEATSGPPPEVRERFAKIEAELQRAQFARDRVGPLLMQIGLAAAIAFGVGYLMSRGESD
jgi:hypothetical protein